MKQKKERAKYKIKKGDSVYIITGKDKGKIGEIEKIFTKKGKAVVSNINIYKKHIKPSQKMPKGGKVEIHTPIQISNIMFICPKCNKRTRVGYKYYKNDKDKKKSRICKKCGEQLWFQD